MITAKETLMKRLESHYYDALAAHDRESVTVYAEFSHMVQDIFANRSFGEAVAVGTKAVQERLSATHDEASRQAWLRCVGMIEQLYIDLS